MMAALINRRDRIEEAASTAFFSLLVSGLLLFAGMLALSPLLGLFFGSPRVAEISAALSGWLFLQAVTIVPDALLQRRLSFARRVAVDPIAASAFGLVSIVACARGAGVWGLVAGAYASMLAQVVSSWAFARARPRWHLASIAMWRELVAFARPVVGSEVLRRMAGQLDAIMLGRFSGAASLGQYRNGLRLAQAPENAFVNVGAYVLLPILARLGRHPERFADAARHVFRVLAAAVVPISFATVPLGVPLAVLVLGSRWRPAGHAIAGLSGVLLGSAIISVSSEIFKAIGRPKLLVRTHAVNLLMTATVVTAGAILFGLIGVAVAVSVSQVVTALYAFGLVTKLIDISWPELGKELAGPALAACAMLAAMVSFADVLRPLSHGEAIALALTAAQVVTGSLVYLAVLMTVDRRRRREARRTLTGLRAQHGPAPS